MLFKIYNQADLKTAYSLLKFANESGSNIVARKLKRDIRNFYRATELTRYIVKDYGIDGYIELVPLPEFLESRENADTYFKACEFIYPYSSAYGCTGREFTSWYKVFVRGGHFWAYHCVRFDV